MSRDAVTAYARKVVAGKIVAGNWVRLACERHLRDLKGGRKRGLYFDREGADFAIEFFGFLKHSKGKWAGDTFQLAPWQKFIVGCLFGWKRKRDGTRRFRTAYCEVPRKNGKSTLAAGIGLYLLVADGEQGAEIYSAATKRDQATIVHGEATRMVRSSPSLRKRVRIYKNNLNVEKSNSKYEPLGADQDTLDGLNVHGAIIDELHAHKTSGVVDKLDTATGAREQPLLFEITTAGYDQQSICFVHHQYTEQVLEGVIEDDSWFGFIATIDKEDDWTDERVWAKANPNYGGSVNPEDLKRKAVRAMKMPTEQNIFKRMHLNVWTEQAERWLDLAEWDECGGAVDLEALKGRKCWVGLDLADTSDLAAMVAVFASDDEEPVFDLVPFFWLPGDNLEERSRKNRVPYNAWMDQGLLRVTEGNVLDYDAVMVALDELAQWADISELAYDRWGATELIQKAQGAGVDVIPFGQGYASMSPAMKGFLTLVLQRRIRHGNHPILRWMASNVVATMDPAGNIKPDKSKSRQKIDGIVASIMGLDRATRREGGSVYDERDMLVL